MARYVCDILNISFIPLSKPKLIKKFDGKEAPPITHAIYPILTVQGHTESLAPFLVTKLGQHSIILGKLWMKKHGVILDMNCDKFIFWPGHCQHVGAFKKEHHVLVKEPATSEKKTPFQKTSEPELLPHILPEHRKISKITTPATYVGPQKRILKSKPKKKPAPINSEKPLNIVFIGGHLSII